jgi:hypothetical protein
MYLQHLQAAVLELFQPLLKGARRAHEDIIAQLYHPQDGALCQRMGGKPATVARFPADAQAVEVGKRGKTLLHKHMREFLCQ